MKSLTRTPALFSCLVLTVAAGFSTPARADEWDKKTIMTISDPIQVPNKVLEPGTYVFKLMDSQSDRHVVQIFNQNETHLVTTILAIPNYRLQPTGKTKFAFWETPAGQPRALRAWFYPGDNFGQEFAYSPTMSAQISASNSDTTVPVESTTVASEATTETAPQAVAPVAAPEPAPAPETTAAVTTEPVTPEPAPQPAVQEPTAQTAMATPTELPHTASNDLVFVLTGLLSLAAFALLTMRFKRAL
jgi:LPXTG-motif cell wall-anchored protein